jgi:hypothetical protein
MSATFALATTSAFNENNRNIHDIRKLRSDNDRSENAREVFVPFNVNFTHYTNLQERANSGAKRYVFFAPCREAGGTLEHNRWWRTKLFKVLQHTDNALVTNNINEKDFDAAMMSSEFCFHMPGDLSSTQKLYRFIFSGCIPIIFVSYRGQLPFHHFIDWNSFSVIVFKDIINNPDALQSFVSYLATLRQDVAKIQDMRKKMAEVAPLFNWEKKDWPSVYHLTLLELRRTDTSLHFQKNSTLNYYLC